MLLSFWSNTRFKIRDLRIAGDSARHRSRHIEGGRPAVACVEDMSMARRCRLFDYLLSSTKFFKPRGEHQERRRNPRHAFHKVSGFEI